MYMPGSIRPGWREAALIQRPDDAARRLVMWLESPENAILSLSDAIGLDALAIPVINWMYRYLPKRRKEYMVVPGVAEMLPRLKRHYPLAVISARDEVNTMAFLEASQAHAVFRCDPHRPERRAIRSPIPIRSSWRRKEWACPLRPA